MDEIKHLGVIMDGNRRWAKTNAMEVFKGHDKGARVFGDLGGWCKDNGIKYLTVYAFSTENWQRSEREIRHLFSLMEKFFLEEKATCLEKGIRMKIIGERTRFDDKILNIIEDIETSTRHCDKLYVQSALSYGGRDEILRAVRQIAAKSAARTLSPDEINEEIFESHLDTAGLPDVDLVIRTGGDDNHRLSNFLPWQTVYSQWYFSDLLWPDFNQDEFNRALKYFYSVRRRMGK